MSDEYKKYVLVDPARSPTQRVWLDCTDEIATLKRQLEQKDKLITELMRAGNALAYFTDRVHPTVTAWNDLMESTNEPPGNNNAG